MKPPLKKDFLLIFIKLNVFIVIGVTAILLIFITSYIIAFSPLREYIPGYSNITNDRKPKGTRLKADSL